MSTIVFEGPAGVATYRAIVLKHALTLYAKHGIKPNRAYTPTAMLQAAGQITGKVYRRGQYELAAADLESWITANGRAR
jgi:hypothetical protein